ncbi:MAG: mechanosensitive ion channel family protein [Rectinemataceae bacterium]
MDLTTLLNHPLVTTSKFSFTTGTLLLWLMIVLLAKVSVWLVSRLINRPVQLGRIDRGHAYSILSVLRYLIWALAIIVALQTGGVNLSLVFAGSAALLVGVGFGIQQIFNDVMSGIILLVEGNLKVGDILQTENDIVGEVRKIGLRTSKIKTRDNVIMIVPNSKFVSERIINWSNEQISTRFHVDVGVGYGSDLKMVETLLLQIAEQEEKLEREPQPFVRFLNFGNSSLDFQVFFWTKETFTVENIKSDLRFSIDREFRAHGVEIPFPQRDVHIK